MTNYSRSILWIFAVLLLGRAPLPLAQVPGDRYTSPRNWFSVQIPKSSNWANVPFSVRERTGNENPGKNFDLVKFAVEDFGEVLIAGVDYFSDEFIESRMKQYDHRTVLAKLAGTAVYFERRYPVEPKMIEETFLETPHGEALLRVYLAEKGSLIASVSSKGGGAPIVRDSFDTLVAVIVAMQKNNSIYGITEHDSESSGPGGPRRNMETLKRRLQTFFAGIAVHR